METKKTQLFYIHGGMTFKNQDDYIHFLKTMDVSIEPSNRWSGSYLSEELQKFCDIIRPRMPLKENAKYEDWKIVFERYFDLFEDDIILVGTSLGGIFLAKYLSENTFPKKIKSVYLVAPPYDDTLENEDLVGGFELQDDLSMIEKNCDDVTLLFSKDDDVVPESQMKGYKSKLKKAKIISYESKNGHFNVEEFPEIIDMIKEDLLEDTLKG